MSGDVSYRVVLSLSTEGNLGANVSNLGARADAADHSLKSLGQSAHGVGDAFESMAHRVGGFFESAADKAAELGLHLADVGAGAVLGVATYGVAHLNNELEQTQISLGAIAQAQGFVSNFEDGFRAAGDQVAKMKQDVKTLPGDLGQLSNLMTMIATPGAQGGMGLDQLRQFAGRTMLTSAILHVPQEVASREMANLLAGRAGSHNILGSRLGLIGDEAKKFNELDPAARVARLNKELDKYGGAADRFGQSLIANWTTFKDNVKYGIIAEATAGPFERVKHGLAEINTYLDDHKDKVKEVADTISRRLVEGWDAAEAAVKRYGPMVGKYADMVLHMQPAELGTKLEHAGAALLGMKLGGMALSGVGSAVGFGMRGASMLGMMGGAGGASAGLGAIASALPALGEAAIVAAPVIFASAGAFDILTDKTSIYHDEAVKLAEDISTRGVRAFEMMGEAAQPAASAVRRLADEAGIGFMHMLDGMAMEFESGAEKALVFSNALAHLNEFFLSDVSAGALQRFRNSKDEVPDIAEHAVEPLQHLVSTVSEWNQRQKAVAKPGAGGGGHIHVEHLQIDIKGNDDPSRVARDTVREFRKAARNPTRSPNVASFEEVRGPGY